MYLLWVVISDRKRKGRDENDFKEIVFSLFSSYNGGSWEITPMKEKTWGHVLLRLIDSLESKQNLLWWIIISKQETSNVSLHLSVLLLSIVFDSPKCWEHRPLHSFNEWTQKPLCFRRWRCQNKITALRAVTKNYNVLWKVMVEGVVETQKRSPWRCKIGKSS